MFRPFLRRDAPNQLQFLAVCHGRKHQEQVPIRYPKNARWTFVDRHSSTDPDYAGNAFNSRWMKRTLPRGARYDLIELRYCPSFAMEGWHSVRGAYRKFDPLCGLVGLLRRPDGILHISRPVADPRSGWSASEQLLDDSGPYSTAMGWVRGVERNCGLRWIPPDSDEWRELNERLGDVLTDKDNRPLGLTFGLRGVLTRANALANTFAKSRAKSHAKPRGKSRAKPRGKSRAKSRDAGGRCTCSPPLLPHEYKIGGSAEKKRDEKSISRLD
jgi:hypothetical protein